MLELEEVLNVILRITRLDISQAGFLEVMELRNWSRAEDIRRGDD